jgi:hypothetical protein
MTVSTKKPEDKGETLETKPEVEAPTEPGFHVMLDGASLGCYPTAADAEAFADGHPRANGLTVEVLEV